MSNRKRSIPFLVGISIGLVLVIYFHAIFYLPFFSDDSLISLRYVDRLLHGKGLTWTDGPAVEGYSNLLWILLIALLGLLGVDLIVASRVLGVACMSIVAIVMSAWYLYCNRITKPFFPILAGMFFFCLAVPVAVWAIGGLEQPLYVALIALSLPLTIQVIEAQHIRKTTIFTMSIILGLICITRPDGPLFSVAAFLSICVGRHFSRNSRISVFDVAWLASMPVLFYGGQLAFRLYYYGEFVPNTAIVKIAPSMHHLKQGIFYILDGFWSLFPFSLLAVIVIVGFLFSPLKRSVGITLLVICSLWIPYIAFVGGNVFPAHRHFLPLIVVFTMAVIEGIAWVQSKLPHPMSVKQKGILIASALVLCSAYLIIQFTNHSNKEAAAEVWEWNGKVIGLALKEAFSEQQPLLAATSAGCVPYWSKLPALDMLGLNDHYLPRHPPADFGKGYLGHELGDGDYVLERKPDIIIYHAGIQRPPFRCYRDMQATDEFKQQYTPVKLQGLNPHRYLATLWIRKFSPRIGIQKTPARINIPGFLLNHDPETISYPNAQGKLVVPVSAGQSVGVALDSIDGQDWNVSIKASRAEEIQSKQKVDGSSLIIRLYSDSPDPIEIEEIVLSKPATVP